MRSRLPKVLHPVAGKPILLHVVDAVRALGVNRIVVVAGRHEAPIRAALFGHEKPQASDDALVLAHQEPALGTGHALLQAMPQVPAGASHILVLNSDAPLVRPETLRALMQLHLETAAVMTITAVRRPDPRGMGRIVRTASGGVARIVEEREATGDELSIAETNGDFYGIAAGWVRQELHCLPRRDNGEYYLTDLVQRAVNARHPVAALTLSDYRESWAVNDRIQLAAAEGFMRDRIRDRLMLAGVTLLDPPSTFIDAGVEVGQDTVIHPNTTITGSTRIGEGCEIGPQSILHDTIVGDACTVVASVLEQAVLEDRVHVGPFSHLRPGAHVEADVHLGNYVEIKNSRIGRYTAIGHFSYIGDATLGKRVNIGAGTITVNYDGTDKHPTTIGDDVFIGSDSMLVAPVTVSDRAATGAGAVVTKDVGPDTLVVGVPARTVPGKRGPRSKKE